MYFKNLTKGLKVSTTEGKEVKLEASAIISHRQTRKGEVKTLLISGGKALALDLDAEALNKLCIARKICGHAA